MIVVIDYELGDYEMKVTIKDVLTKEKLAKCIAKTEVPNGRENQKVSETMSYQEMIARFDLVKNRINWKNPFKAAFEISDCLDIKEEAEKFVEACEFFTGSGRYSIQDNFILIYGEGYYNAIGA